MKKNLRDVLTEIGMENDSISIMVDVSSLEEIKYYYSLFGWKLKDQKRDKVFHRTYHLEFKRSHFIEDKDKLQKYEVEFESNVKDLNRLKVRKNLKSSSMASGGYLLGFAFLIAGILFLTMYSQVLSIYWSIMLIVLGSLFIISITPFFLVTRSKENKCFDEEFARLSNERSRIFDKTLKLRGVKE